MVIDFACTQIDLREIIMCSFNLNKTDYKLLTELFKLSKPVSVVKLGRIAGLERSTVQKSLKNLLSKDLVRRGQVNMSRGGYVFTYKAKDKKVIKQRVLEIVNSWNRRVEKEVLNW